MQPSDDLINDFEQLQGQPLEEADYQDIQAWQNGVELRSTVNTPGWEVAMATLQSYADKANEDLYDLLPGDPTVPLAFAAASALRQINIKFRQDVRSAVEAAQQVPEVLKRGLQNDFSRGDGQS